MSWIELVVDKDFEIFDEYPHQIRRKKNQRIIKESLDKSNGYIQIHLNKKKFYKHRVIALQFIPNPNNYKYVDHVDMCRQHNEISNLRFVSSQQNNNNKSNQTLVDELPDDSIVVDKYNNNEFEFLYFSLETNRFYYYNGINYNVKAVYRDKYGNYRTYITDTLCKQRSISYNKFKREYDLI